MDPVIEGSIVKEQLAGEDLSFMTQAGLKLIANWQQPLRKHAGTIYRSHMTNLVKPSIFFVFSPCSLIIYDGIMAYILIKKLEI